MDTSRQIDYDITYMKMAICMSELSYAVRSKVGCIIISDDKQIISQGFNGMPHGMDNCCEYWRPIDKSLCNKCKNTFNKDCNCNNKELVTKKEVLHAESNAISKCAKWEASTEGATCYVTLSPCIDCSKLLIQAGIKRVVIKDIYRIPDGLKLLIECGITVEMLDIENKTLKNIDIKFLNDKYNL